MIPFRSHTPRRRINPTLNPNGDNWSEHKPDLKIDFQSRCGYCNSVDGFRHTYFEVDHFIPKDFLKKYKRYSLTDYKNLVYACKFCNNAKRAKWPSRSRKRHNDGSIGFVDPCDKTYRSHFYRTADGGIMWRTALGKWMFSEAFKFDERQNAIKLLWNLDRLDQLINAMTLVLNRHTINTQKYRQIKVRIGEYCFEYYQYHKELIKYYDSI